MSDENKNPAENQVPPVPPIPPAEAVAQQEAAELNISDLNAMKMIIDVASSRGAFKPAEMLVIGQTYNKLTNFLDSVAKQQPKGA
jgi:hypothetical protein